jgi:hypothetical protein
MQISLTYLALDNVITGKLWMLSIHLGTVRFITLSCKLLDLFCINEFEFSTPQYLTHYFSEEWWRVRYCFSSECLTLRCHCLWSPSLRLHTICFLHTGWSRRIAYSVPIQDPRISFLTESKQILEKKPRKWHVILKSRRISYRLISDQITTALFRSFARAQTVDEKIVARNPGFGI